ncbi:MAG: chromosomal replication initiator protein DnaA [Candidatus Omnitrophica bacterium]|nr:chromosomal replication initiator protein DnaA [Candidatus Omnitrophota bacterium]
MQIDLNQIWNEVLVLLKRSVPAQSFETWLKPTKAIKSDGEVLTIEVPNKFFKDWLLDHYSALLTETFNKLTAQALRLEFVVGNNPAELEYVKSPLIANSTLQNTPLTVRHKPDIYLNPKYTFDSFVVGSSNRFAHAASTAVAESPARAYNPLFIYGGVGLGKTHLMQAVGHFILEKNAHAKLSYTTSERFTNQLISAIQTRNTMRFRENYRNVDILLIDDIQFIAGKESTQEEFFHTFNTLYDAHKQIVISSDRSPKEISGLEERLISRFEWGLVTDIQPPDLETRIAILRKKAEREIVKVPDDVMFFIAEKIHSNIRELEGSLIRVVAYSLLTNSLISIKLAEEVLKDAIKEDDEEKIITIDKIQKIVAQNFDVKLADIKRGGRTKVIAYPRHLAMYLSRELTKHSLSEIGENFGGRDHTTVLHAYEKIKNQIKIDLKLSKLLTTLINKIKNQ